MRQRARSIHPESHQEEPARLDDRTLPARADFTASWERFEKLICWIILGMNQVAQRPNQECFKGISRLSRNVNVVAFSAAIYRPTGRSPTLPHGEMSSSFEHAEDEDRTRQCGRDAFRHHDLPRQEWSRRCRIIPRRSLTRTGQFLPTKARPPAYQPSLRRFGASPK